jgi:hypothetical protein
MNVGFFARPLDHALHCIIVALSKKPLLGVSDLYTSYTGLLFHAFLELTNRVCCGESTLPLRGRHEGRTWMF